MDNIYTRFTCRLIDKHLVPDPTQLTSIDHVCDMSDTQQLYARFLSSRGTGTIFLLSQTPKTSATSFLHLTPR